MKVRVGERKRVAILYDDMVEPTIVYKEEPCDHLVGGGPGSSLVEILSEVLLHSLCFSGRESQPQRGVDNGMMRLQVNGPLVTEDACQVSIHLRDGLEVDGGGIGCFGARPSRW